MKPVLRILLKVLVQQFYLRNTGFFLFLFVVLFGVVQNPLSYHLSLMQGIVSSYTTLVIAVIIWVLYGCKCVVFILKALAEKEHAFLYQLQALTFRQIFVLLNAVQALLLLPVLVYEMITAGVGFYIHQPVAAIAILLSIAGMQVISVVLYYYCIASPAKKVRFTLPLIFHYHLPKPFYSFLLYYNLYQGKVKTAAVKFVSFVLLFIPLVWNGDHFEFSDFIIFFGISIAAHAVIIFDGIQFLENDFKVLRNTPLPLYKLFLLFLITYTLLLLPEAIILWHYSHRVALSVPVTSLIVYYIAMLLFFTALSYEKGIKIENYLLYIGLITVLSLFIAPLKSFAVEGLCVAAIAFVMFAGLYYKYERE